MTEAVFVISPRQNAFFGELARVLAAALEEVGLSARVESGFEDPEPGRAFVLLPPGEFFEIEGPEAWPDRLTRARTIFVTAEQPGGKFFRRNLRLPGVPHAWFDLNRLAVREYRRSGVAAGHLQLGYTPLWDRFGTGSRDVDVAFLGCATPHRVRATAAWAPQLVGLRSRLILSDNSRPNPASSASFLAGERKLELLSRSRVLLNAHRGDAPYFEWVRVLEAIHCGAAVVSERSIDHEPLDPDTQLLFGEAGELGAIAKELLADEGRRAELAASA